MASPLARKITRADYHLILRVLEDLATKLKASGKKAAWQYFDPTTVTRALYDMGTAFIVEEAYLVAYTLGTPWYSKDGIIMLHEELVVRLAAGGDFSVVPAFLADKAREAGAVLAIAGTALAKADNALASLYHRAGFSTQALTLVKEP